MSKLRSFLLGLGAGIAALIFALLGRRREPEKVIAEAQKRDDVRETKSQEIARDVERYAREAEAAERAPVNLPTTQEARDAELRRLGELK